MSPRSPWVARVAGVSKGSVWMVVRQGSPEFIEGLTTNG